GWLHNKSTVLPQCFYRAFWRDDYVPQAADNFGLVDHQGKWRELFYYVNATNTKAFVLVFTGNGCARAHDYIPTLNALRTSFSSRGVVFWMIDANQQDNRSNIVVEANAWSIGMPILHDRAQVVARIYGATKTPEAVCIGKPDWSVFYRGAVDDRLGATVTSTTQNYLSNALANFLASQPVSPIQTAVDGCDISFRPRYDITYSRDIGPLLENKCGYCHSPGNIAPFPMTNYTIVALLKDIVKEHLLHGHMPPWFADPSYGHFTNDRSLTPDELPNLIQW